MGENSANAGVWHRIVHTVALFDIADKFANLAEEETEWFFCPHDPRSPNFKLFLDFGLNDGEFSVYLHVKDKPVLINYTLKLFNEAGEKLALKEYSNDTLKVNSYTGEDLFKPTEANMATSWRFLCDIEYKVIDKAELEDEAAPKKSTLHTDLLKLLETEDNADITFMVQGERIKAHKGVLSARCDYFQKMFKTDTQECLSNEVKVPDFKPNVFRAMLQFLYSDTLPKDFAEVSLDLLVAADKYGVKKLKQKCESDAPLDVSNVVDALNMAEKIDCKRLMVRAKKVFKINFDVMMQSDEAKEKLSKSLFFELLSFFKE